MSLIDRVDDADIQKFEINDSVVSDEQAVGSFNLNLATIKLVNAQKQYNWTLGQWLNTEMGQLYVYEAPETQGEVTIELKCYDLAYKFDVQYMDVITFPATLGEWLSAICTQVGVELATTEFPNSTLVLDSQPFLADKASFRDAVREIAGAAGGFAQIIGNQLHIRWFDAEDPIEVADWFELTQGEQVEAVNVVVLGRGDVEDNIAYPSETPDDPHELRIDDNQVLFQRERETIEAIYARVVGFQYRVFDLRFIGLKDVKAGSAIRYHDIDGELMESFVMSNYLTFCGGDYNDPNAWESKVSAVHLKETNTGYQYAGGIVRTLRNTEAKVDKTNQRIDFEVSERKALDDKVDNNFSLVTQNISSVITSIQNSGGNNLIRNSAFYFRESNGGFTSWEVSGDGTIEVVPSGTAGVNSSLSGQLIKLVNKTIKQTIKVGGSTGRGEAASYTFSCKIHKLPSGECSVIISNGHTWREIKLLNGEDADYKEFSIDGITAEVDLTVSVYGSDESDFGITDMMLSVGDYRSQWQQANGELANTQLQIDIRGVKATSSTIDVSSELNSQGFYTKSSNNIISALTNGGLSTPEVSAGRGINMPPIKIVPQDNGWAFVPCD